MEGVDFLIRPIFSRGSSASLHLILLLVLFISWLCKKTDQAGHEEEPKRRLRNASRFSYYKQALFSCLGLSTFSLALCCVTYFYLYRSGWSDKIDIMSVSEELMTLLDLILTALAWFAVFVYLLLEFSHSSDPELPSLLKIWWGFYLFDSSYCLVVDIVLMMEHRPSSPTYFLVSDVIFVIFGSFLCYVGFWGKHEGENPLLLEEPLLNGIAPESSESSKSSRGCETVTPYSNANVHSILTFSWMNPLFSVGNNKTLDLEDVPQLASRDSVTRSYPDFRNKVESYGNGSGGVTAIQLVKALIFIAWKDIVWTAFLELACTLATFTGPYLINPLVRCLNGHWAFENEGYALVAAFSVGKLVECLAQRHWSFRVQQVGIRFEAALVAMIYNKSLTLSSLSKQSHTSGEIINFMTIDSERVGDFSWCMHDPWSILLQVALALIILYKNLGLAFAAAFFATVLVMLANVPLAKIQKKYQKKLMTSKDRRMKVTSEVLRNMRILKLQGWEMKFLSKITDLRDYEAGWLKKCFYTLASIGFVFRFTPTFVSMVTFGACLLLGIPLNSGKILSALATFGILQQPISGLSHTVSMIAQTRVSLERIASFLRLQDLQEDAIEKLPKDSSDIALEIIEGNFSWDSSSANPTLKDINIKAWQGTRVAVCGAVGSGKSSLLSSVLGEVPKISGIVQLCGTKAYVSQSPWIQSGKIEDSILFGKEMDRERYERVLEACSLKKDLEILSFGDQTIIGERGINLSGGQKQRIQIARALYQDADIYLFDDPFSAVDAHTGTHLFKECLLGFLSSKTVIYVTHQVEFLPAADHILVMKAGRITQSGKYNDICIPGTDFMELVGAHNEALLTLNSIEKHSDREKINTTEEDNGVECGKMTVQREEAHDSQNGEAEGPNCQLVQEEEREKGKVGFSVYWKYITMTYGGALVPFILLSQILFQVLQIGSNYWMTWAGPTSDGVEPAVKGSTLVTVYVVLAIGSCLCTISISLLVVTIGCKTANLLFNKIHFCIFRAPMSFFDSTPSGRILNRVSTDQSTVDLAIPPLFSQSSSLIIQLISIVAIMSQVAWQVFIVCIPVIAMSLWYQQYYIPSARELSRLVGVCKAPLIQHFAETISGSTTIRSFDQQLRFQVTSMSLQDAYSRTKFHIAAAMEWLCFRLDMLSSITFVFSLVFLISIPEGTIDPGFAGLAVTYGLKLNIIQVLVTLTLCRIENEIISVERMLQYTNIPSEPALVREKNKPDYSWPSYGEVSISDLQVRYAPQMPLVLRGLTCTFLGGMKTGIVGRTGSGKSTLIQTIFRIVEPSVGQIMIDGVDISSIGLHDLRSRLSIIPQDPTMFEGTVRSNLDPLEEYTDEQIWEALDKCQLGDEVRNKEGKLDSTVNENGENWSMGERQLICLGRVLLKKSKILVLDEATASVDTTTENLIQQTLRQHFTKSTIITIAHRITSVLESDMVLLLDHGLIEEYDSPTRLLEDTSSSFSKLVAEYTVRSNMSVKSK